MRLLRFRRGEQAPSIVRYSERLAPARGSGGSAETESVGQSSAYGSSAFSAPVAIHDSPQSADSQHVLTNGPDERDRLGRAGGDDLVRGPLNARVRRPTVGPARLTPSRGSRRPQARRGPRTCDCGPHRSAEAAAAFDCDRRGDIKAFHRSLEATSCRASLRLTRPSGHLADSFSPQRGRASCC